jgi:hypothetical protein
VGLCEDVHEAIQGSAVALWPPGAFLQGARTVHASEDASM